MRVSLKQVRVGIVITALMLLAFFGGFKVGSQGVNFAGRTAVRVDRSQPREKATIDMDLFWQVWDRLNESYLIKEALKPQEMVWGAIKGMTAALNDPYTVFLPPEDNQESKEELEGTFEGVGIELGYKNETLAVIAPLEGMPARAAGIQAGDLILRIKDEVKGIDQETSNISLPQAVKLIRGPKGSQVELTVLHEGETEPAVIKIRRDTIVIKSVELSWLGKSGNLAHLKLMRFGGRTEAEWNEAVDRISKKKDLDGVILDLRNNPGGYLNGAVEYGAEFLPLGAMIVKQESADGKSETYSVSRQGKLLSPTLVVLVNKGSASSAEILAGALRDHGRGKIIGEKTFGKGTIQEAVELSGGAGLHVTTAKWLLPKGEWVNESGGLKPEIEVKDDPETDVDEALARAVELL